MPEQSALAWPTTVTVDFNFDMNRQLSASTMGAWRLEPDNTELPTKSHN